MLAVNSHKTVFIKSKNSTVMKKILFINVVALSVIFGFSACDKDLPEMVEANDVEVATTRAAVLEWDEGFGFHCNHAKGNGRTDVKIGTHIFRANNQNDNGRNPAMHATLFRVGETTVWQLVPIAGEIVCETCGRTDWVTYSNKNGVINGKNIQAHHPKPGEVPVEPDPEFTVLFMNYKAISEQGSIQDFEKRAEVEIDRFIANKANGFATQKPNPVNPNAEKYVFIGWKRFTADKVDGQTRALVQVPGKLIPSPETLEMLQNIDQNMVVYAVFYEFAPVEVSYNRYLAYVHLWNNFDQKYGRPYVVSMNAEACALRHYFALLAHFGQSSLPPYWHFCSEKQDVYDYWADQLEPGLKRMAADKGVDLDDWVKTHISNTAEMREKCNANCNC